MSAEVTTNAARGIQDFASVASMDKQAATQALDAASLSKNEMAQMMRILSAKSGIALEPPEADTRNWLWKVVILAFSIVLVGSFAALAASLFITVAETGDVQMILTVFMTVVAFLAGLFAPSPVQR